MTSSRNGPQQGDPDPAGGSGSPIGLLSIKSLVADRRQGHEQEGLQGTLLESDATGMTQSGETGNIAVEPFAAVL